MLEFSFARVNYTILYLKKLYKQYQNNSFSNQKSDKI